MSLYGTASNSSTATYARTLGDLGTLAYIIQSTEPGARLVYSVYDSDKPGHRAYFETPVHTYIRLFKPTFPPETDKLISYANTCGESLSTAATHGSVNSLFRTSALIFERFRISWLRRTQRGYHYRVSPTGYANFRSQNRRRSGKIHLDCKQDRRLFHKFNFELVKGVKHSRWVSSTFYFNGFLSCYSYRLHLCVPGDSVKNKESEILRTR